MAAPVATVRLDPTGIKLEDGYRSLITIAADVDINLWEIAVGTPGIDGGDAIETTTMHNDDWRTFSPRDLMTLTEFTFTFAYDPQCYTECQNAVNLRTTITRSFRDGSTVAFYGFLKGIEFDPAVEGEMPTGTATIVPTNWDPTNRVEAGPAVVSVAGS